MVDIVGFPTLNLTAVAVAVLLTASCATAVSVCGPFATPSCSS